MGNRVHILRIAGLVGLVIAAGLLLFWGYHVRAGGNGQATMTQLEPHDFGSQMHNYIKQGRYDDAVQVGLHALQNQSSDEIVYQEIAVVYLMRAQKEPEQRERWVSTAISYIDKSLSLNSKDKDAAGVHLLQDALSLESAGDLSTNERCSYYGRARKLLEDRAPLLQGDQLTLAGKTFPLEPLRKENEKVLTGLKDKATKAGCK